MLTDRSREKSTEIDRGAPTEGTSPRHASDAQVGRRIPVMLIPLRWSAESDEDKVVTVPTVQSERR